MRVRHCPAHPAVSSIVGSHRSGQLHRFTLGQLHLLRRKHDRRHKVYTRRSLDSSRRTSGNAVGRCHRHCDGHLPGTHDQESSGRNHARHFRIRNTPFHLRLGGIRRTVGQRKFYLVALRTLRGVGRQSHLLHRYDAAFHRHPAHCLLSEAVMSCSLYLSHAGSHGGHRAVGCHYCHRLIRTAPVHTIVGSIVGSHYSRQSMRITLYQLHFRDVKRHACHRYDTFKHLHIARGHHARPVESRDSDNRLARHKRRQQAVGRNSHHRFVGAPPFDPAVGGIGRIYRSRKRTGVALGQFHTLLVNQNHGHRLGIHIYPKHKRRHIALDQTDCHNRLAHLQTMESSVRIHSHHRLVGAVPFESLICGVVGHHLRLYARSIALLQLYVRAVRRLE